MQKGRRTSAKKGEKHGSAGMKDTSESQNTYQQKYLPRAAATTVLPTDTTQHEEDPSEPSILALAFEGLLRDPSKVQRLYELEQDQLVALVGLLAHKCAGISKERDELRRENKAGQRKNYIVQPTLDELGAGVRVDDFERVDKLQQSTVDKWRFSAQGEQYDAGLPMPGKSLSVAWDKTKKAFIFTTDTRWYKDPNMAQLCEVISSALLQYRLCALFELVMASTKGAVLGVVDRYKKVWAVYLVHKASGYRICFSDFKGGARMWPEDFMPPKSDAEKEFLDDTLQLINLLCSEECLHPYDACVAGSTPTQEMRTMLEMASAMNSLSHRTI